MGLRVVGLGFLGYFGDLRLRVQGPNSTRFWGQTTNHSDSSTCDLKSFTWVLGPLGKIVTVTQVLCGSILSIGCFVSRRKSGTTCDPQNAFIPEV